VARGHRGSERDPPSEHDPSSTSSAARWDVIRARAAGSPRPVPYNFGVRHAGSGRIRGWPTWRRGLRKSRPRAAPPRSTRYGARGYRRGPSTKLVTRYRAWPR
jgi:hypothetical protein